MLVANLVCACVHKLVGRTVFNRYMEPVRNLHVNLKFEEAFDKKTFSDKQRFVEEIRRQTGVGHSDHRNGVYGYRRGSSYGKPKT